jgi:hypothetical protein
MKSLLFALLIVPVAAGLADISRALGSGNADALGQYLDNSVEISVLDQENVYTKAQAVQVIRQFFTKNPPRNFSLVHQGASKGSDSEYCIGNLTTANGSFRVYLYMKVTGTNYLIQELRFDQE